MNNLSPTEIAQLCLDSPEKARPYLRLDVIIELHSMANKQGYSNSLRAQEIAEIALSMAEFLNDALAMAWAAWSKGIALSFAQYPHEALPFYQEAEAVFHAHEQSIPLVKLQAGLIYVLTRCGKFKEALALAEEARPRCKRLCIDGLNALGQLEMNVGSIYRLQGKYDLALQIYEQAIQAFTKANSEIDIARLKINSANVCQNIDQYEEAECLYHGAHQILQQTAPEMQDLCLVNFNLGQLADKLGQYQKALRYLEQARAGFIPEAHIAITDMARAQIYNTLNLYQEASVLARDAVQIYERVNIPDNLAQALHTEAVAWRGLGNLKMAHRILLKARDHFSAHNARQNVALVDLALAELALETHDPQLADQFAHRLTNWLDGSLGRNLAAEAHLLQARISYALYQDKCAPTKIDLQDVYRALQKALHFTTQHSPKLRAGIYHLLSKIYTIQSKPRAAWSALCQAISYLESMRTNLLLDEFQMGLMDEQRSVYLEGLNLLQNSAIFDDATDEQTQWRAMFYLLNLAATSPLTQISTEANLDPDLDRQLHELRTLWHWQQAKLMKSQSGEDEPDHMTDEMRRQNIAELTAAITETECQIADLGRRCGIRTVWHVTPAPLLTAPLLTESLAAPLQPKGNLADNENHSDNALVNQFQAQAEQFCNALQRQLASHEALLHYYTHDEQVYLLMMDSTEIYYYAFGPIKSVQQILRNWKQHLQGTHLIFKRPEVANNIAERILSALGQMLVQPVLDRLSDISHLYLVYPVEWHEIPLAALRTSDGYLIERFQLTHLSTPESLLRQTPRRDNPATLVPSTHVDHKPHALILGYSEGETLLHNLYESHQVQQTLSQSGWATTLLQEEEVTRSSLYASMRESRIVHLATHAFFQPENPLFSWVRLADSQLTVADIYHQTALLNQPLVVLSACETGRGQVRGGGLLGMARALLVSGAQSVVVSLWRVEDQATAQLMEFFYQQMNRIHTPFDSGALCQAQRRMATTQHPFFWAGFIYIGG